MSSSIFTMSESDDSVICLRLTGTISAADYMQYFDEPVRRMAREKGVYNLLVYYDSDFVGWSAEAADLSFKCITEVSPLARYLAYINPPGGRVAMMQILKPMMKAQVRFYEESEVDEAVAWIKASAKA